MNSEKVRKDQLNYLTLQNGLYKIDEEILMENAGQACNAGKRFLVSEHLYDQFVDGITAKMAALTTGDPFDPEIFNRRQRATPTHQAPPEP